MCLLSSSPLRPTPTSARSKNPNPNFPSSSNNEGSNEESNEDGAREGHEGDGAGVERLYHFLKSSTRSLGSSEVTSLVDASMDLLWDGNFWVLRGEQ